MERDQLIEQRIVCPIHGMPDCSPLLNGCTLVNWAHNLLAEEHARLRQAIEAMRAQRPRPEHEGTHQMTGWVARDTALQRVLSLLEARRGA